GLAGIEHGARLHKRGLDVGFPLTIHAVEVDRLPELIEDHDADPHALFDGLLDARFPDRFRGHDVDLVLLPEDLAFLATHQEFGAFSPASKPRNPTNALSYQQADFYFHFLAPFITFSPCQFSPGFLALRRPHHAPALHGGAFDRAEPQPLEREADHADDRDRG